MSKNYFGQVELVEEEQIPNAIPTRIVSIDEGNTLNVTTIEELAALIGSGTVPDLQTVTDEGNTTTNPIIIGTTTYQDGSINANSQNYLFPVGGGGSTVAVSWNGVPTSPNGDITFPIDTSPVNNSNALIISGGVYNALLVKAPLISPALTGTPTAPTAAPGTNTTQIATMAALQTAVASVTVPIDAVPTDGSNNAVSSNGVFDALVLKENTANKQNSLATDGTGVKYATVDAVNAGITAATVPQASTTVIGKSRFATQSEVNASTATDLAVSPATMDVRVTAKIAAITTDQVPATTTNRYVTTGTTLPSATGVNLRYLTSPLPLTTTDSYYTANGFVGRNGSLIFPITMGTRAGATADWIGDSFVDGYLLGGEQQSFRGKVTGLQGWNSIDNATVGARVPDKYKGLLNNTIAEIRFLGLGVNDMRLYGATAAPAYANMMRGLALSSYDREATKGQAMTLSGTGWANDTLQADTTTGVVTAVTGDSATFVRVGTTIYLTMAHMPTGTATYTVTIDSVQVGGTYSTDSGATLVGYPSPTGAASAAYYPFTHRFTGLSNEPHTVVVTKTGGSGTINTLRIIWALSNSGLRTSQSYVGLSQYVLTVWRMSTAAYGTYSGNLAGISDATVATFNAAQTVMLNELNDDGLNIQQIDAASSYSPNDATKVQSDGFHPTAVADSIIADTINNKVNVYDTKQRYDIDRLTGKLALKANDNNVMHLGTTGAGVAETANGVKTFPDGIRSANIMNSAGSTTQGTLIQASSTKGWGVSSSRATGTVSFSDAANSTFTGKIHAFTKNNVDVAYVNDDGTMVGANATANNHFVTLQQLNATQSTYVDVTGTSVTMVKSNKYKANNIALVTLTLPTTGALGDQFFVRGYGTGKWKLQMPTGAILHGNTDTAAGGYISAQTRYDTVAVEVIAVSGTTIAELTIISNRGTLNYDSL